ncbi:MAG: tetratricopeptide repeat protein [Proteobacteria bacterium]|nr:tetratricopeptide repeat protein [Pseudomonadota bacterium]
MNNKLLDGFFLQEVLVEPLIGRVSGSGEPAHLPSKSIEVLLCLAKQPRRLVSREELLAKVWGDGNGSPEALSHAVSEIRHALGDQADDPVFIQTVPKRGYRLLCEARLRDASRQAASVVPESTSPAVTPFWSALLRHGVVQAGFAYLVVGWLLIQVADATFLNLGLPTWAMPFITFVVVGGFPVAVLLAWFIEVAEGRMIRDRGEQPGGLLQGLERNYLAIIAAYGIAALGAGTYQFSVGFNVPENGSVQAAEPALIPIEPNSIAVLQLMNIDGSEETTIFSNGLVEDVINRLARIPGLHVSSRGDSFSLPVNSSSSEVRQRLRVNYYIEGSVRLTEEKIRVVIQLIESANGQHLLSRSFDRERKDFFEIQDEITSLTVANLRVALPQDTQTALGTAINVASIDAYILYRRGIEELHKPMTVQTIEQALDWFSQSLEIDPDYAAAHAGICLTYSSGFNIVDDPVFINEAEQACASALELSPNLYIVHNALGDLYWETGKHQEAEASYLRALAINQNDVSAVTGLAMVQSSQQRLAEAEENFRQAIALQPGNWRSYDALGRFLYQNGRYEEAAAAYEEVVSLDTENMQGWGNLGTSLMLSGNFTDAAPAFNRSIDVEPQVDAYANLGLMYYYLGKTDAAVTALENATSLAPDDHLVWANLGDALSFSQQTARSSQVFNRAEGLAESRLAVNRKDAETMIDLAWIKAMLGKMEDAEALIVRAQRIAPSDPYVHYIHGLVLTRMGEHTAALVELETAVEMGYPLVMLAAEPHLTELKEKPRFVALVNKQDLK